MARVSIMSILMVFAATAMLVDMAVAVDSPRGASGGWDLAANKQAMHVDMAVAVDITVGSPNGGWDLSTDLISWALSQTFSVGDNLDFQFTSTHDVLEVTRENYDSCGLGSPISTTVTSPARFPLTAEGSRYFICGRGTHCSQGMKVQIDVGSGTSTTLPAYGPTSSSPPPSSSAITLKMNAGSVLGFGVLVIMLVSL